MREGYISSYFGERMDPFNGEEAMHKGVDFATDAGTDVLAVASGIVTWAGPREGYGNLVEINHGNGYTTRYAHNAQTLVTVGDTVSAARPWPWSARPAAPPGRTCISKCCAMARRSIPWPSWAAEPRQRSGRRQNDYFGALSTLTIVSPRSARCPQAADAAHFFPKDCLCYRR